MSQFNPFGTNQSFGGLDVSFLSRRPRTQGQATPPRRGPSYMDDTEWGNIPLTPGNPNNPVPAMNRLHRARAAGQAANQPPNLITQLGLAGLNDAMRMQGAADRQFDRNQAEIEGMRGFMQTAPGRIEQAAGQQADALSAEAQFLRDNPGVDLAEFDRFRNNAMRTTRQGVQGAMRDARAATGEFRQGLDEYRKTGVQDASVAAAGIRESFQQSTNMFASGLTADGRRMTTAEQMAGQAQAREQAERAVGQAVMPHLQRLNENLLQGASRLADLKQFESNMRLQGTSLQSQEALGYSGQRIEAQAMNQRMLELSSNLNAQSAAIRAGGTLQAVNFEMQGRQVLADLVRANPESVVGIMPVISAMLGAATAPGVQNIQGFTGGEFNAATPSRQTPGGTSGSRTGQSGLTGLAGVLQQTGSGRRYT